jgi:hypothetical protein
MTNQTPLLPSLGERQAIEPISARDEARRFPRHSFRGRALAIVFPVRKETEPTECEVMTTDISRGGLSLLYRKQLFPGQQILLVLSDSTQLVEVRWCCRAWAGLYAAGCAFVGLSAEGPIPAVAGQVQTPDEQAEGLGDHGAH